MLYDVKVQKQNKTSEFDSTKTKVVKNFEHAGDPKESISSTIWKEGAETEACLKQMIIDLRVQGRFARWSMVMKVQSLQRKSQNKISPGNYRMNSGNK